MIRATYGATASTSVSVGQHQPVGVRPTGSVPGGTGLIAGRRWKHRRREQDDQQRPRPRTRAAPRAPASAFGADGVERLLAPQRRPGSRSRSRAGSSTTAASRTRTAELTSRRRAARLTGCCAAASCRVDRCSRPVEPGPVLARPPSWSRLSCSRSAARLSGVALRPRIARAGSPSAWVAAKTITETSEQHQHAEQQPSQTMKPVMPLPLAARLIAGAPAAQANQMVRNPCPKLARFSVPLLGAKPATLGRSRRSGC